MTEADRALLRYAIPTNEMLELEVQHIREVLKLKEDAVKLQAAEYHRRLDDLNHEAERLKSMQGTYLPRELYESRHREIDIRLTTVERNVWLATGGLAALFATWKLLEHFIK